LRMSLDAAIILEVIGGDETEESNF
jgi:hypothetical protein